MRTPAPAGFGFFLGAVLAVAATLVVVVAGARSQPVLSVVGLVAVVDLVAMISTATAALATAAVCWCLHSGFVLGTLGELTFTAKSGHDALVLVGCALGGILLASTLRASSALLHEREYDPSGPAVPVQRVPGALTPAR